ncbi:MAG: hypothetical protein WC774_00840 [Candidatus Gracilibacteria bacterium]
MRGISYFIDGCDAETTITHIINRIQEYIQNFNEKERFTADGKIIELTAGLSTGYKVWDGTTTLERLIELADEEMYKAKQKNGDVGNSYRTAYDISQQSPLGQAETLDSLLAITPDFLSANIHVIRELTLPLQEDLINKLLADNPELRQRISNTLS